MTKTFSANVIAPEIRAKIERARATAVSLPQRDLNCPICGFRVNTVFSDTGGHLQSKCKKCGEETIYNLTPGTVLDFRRMSD